MAFRSCCAPPGSLEATSGEYWLVEVGRLYILPGCYGLLSVRCKGCREIGINSGKSYTQDHGKSWVGIDEKKGLG